MTDTRHIPVMVDEVLQHLLHPRARLVVDGTVGYGGHAEAILRERGDVELIGADRDPAAITAAATRLSPFRDRVRLVQGLYSDFAAVFADGRRADGILLDLGISSPQIDQRERGFAHGQDGPLDMRMSGEGTSAASLLARADLDTLTGWLREFGEVRHAKRVARAILHARDHEGMTTTAQLRAAVVDALGRGAAPSELSRVFQAVRIVVNDELASLRAFLDGVVDHLDPGGRLVIISYHSLEDRMVKQFMRDASASCVCPPSLPVCVCGRTPALRMLTRRAVGPRDEEIQRNPRARSARLRAAEKVGTDAS
ncbi:MAG TPA: 16S rRNA (cytosine(1402)-N(4))-methyltransferase RsmH [Candidatus Krumholzibacteria bacterium]